jgi:thiamine biosynthesis lipoprotein ApbE
MAALGFHEREADGEDPRAPGVEGLELDPGEQSVRFRAQGMALDLGAAGKGFALDQAARVLRAAGVRDALLHGGTSTVLGLGAPPGRAHWGIALVGAGAPEVALRDRALSVSAQHGRTRLDAAGVRHGHVLDPRTSGTEPEQLVNSSARTFPARSRPTGAEDLTICSGTVPPGAAAVVADSALLADCWSTALLVLAGRAVEPVLPAGTVAAALGTAAGWRLLGPPGDAFVIQRALPA